MAHCRLAVILLSKKRDFARGVSRNLRDVGKVELVKTEKKGKNNRRIYFKLN
jgi:hypothetical protein